MGVATLVVKAVSECRLRACCDIFGGGAGGVAATTALVMGLLGAELVELVLLDVLELGLVVTVELESFDEVCSVIGGGGTDRADIVYCRLLKIY